MAEQNRSSANGVGEVPQRNVRIPGEFLGDFTAAIVAEIPWEAECIKDAKVGADEVRFADIRSDAKLMAHDVAFFDQLDDVEGDTLLHVEGLDQLDSLPHVFEAMVRKVVMPRLREAVEFSPLDRAAVDPILDLAERLTWAADNASAYHLEADEVSGRKVA